MAAGPDADGGLACSTGRLIRAAHYTMHAPTNLDHGPSMTQAIMPRLGIDWGSSNRRAYLLGNDGTLLRDYSDEGGILHVGDFAASLRSLLDTLELERADVVMTGMVGSRNGWREAPYLTVTHPIPQLRDALMEIDTALPGVRCRIAPGYRFIDPHGAPDVMRGEEAQVLGALELGAAGGWFLLPGTHSKWVRIEQGRVGDLVTFMTGELYALMSEHGTLSKVMQGHETVPQAFEAGLDAARHGSFTHLAFTCRARVVTDMMPSGHAASFLSGLLIGAELHDILRRPGIAGEGPVQVIGSAALASSYLAALKAWRVPARAWNPDEVYVAALRSLFGIGN